MKTNFYIIGGMGSGKTTVANYLTHYLPKAKRLTLAEPIKQIVSNIDIMSDEELLNNFIRPFYNATSEQLGTWERIFEETRTIPEDGKKNRKRLQFLGTDGARKRVDDQIWIKIAIEKARQEEKTIWVVDDCRFINEALAFDEAGWSPIYLHIEPEKQIDRLKKLYGSAFSENDLKHQSEIELKEIKVPTKSIFVSYENKEITLNNIKKYVWNELQ